VWDAESGEETLFIRQPGPFWNFAVAWSPDGRRFASGSDDVRMYDATTGEQVLPPLDCGDRAASLAWSPDGKVLAAGHFNRQLGEIRARVVLWDADTGRELATSAYAKVSGERSPVAWRPDGAQLVAGARGCLRVWDSALREETVVRGGPDWGWHHNRSLTWSPDGRQFATCSGEEIIIHDATDWTLIRSINSKARSLKWHPNGTRIAAATDDGVISIFDTSTGRQV
jgi:WD40 repeat protein